MFYCERCESRYNATIAAASRDCPHCQESEGVSAPLRFRLFEPSALKVAGLSPAVPALRWGKAGRRSNKYSAFVKAKPIAAAVGVSAVVVLFLSGAAVAGPRPPSHRLKPSVSEQFSLEGTDGFTIGLNLRDRHELSLSAASFQGPGSRLAEYRLEAPQPPGSDAIKAGLGRFGRIDVRFVVDSVKEKEPLLPSCHGGKTVIEEGHFVGRIAFRGERGYTRVHADRAPGTISVTPALTCVSRGAPSRDASSAREKPMADRGEPGEGSEVQVVRLTATARGARVRLDASRLSGRDRKGKEIAFTSFFVLAHRDRGRIEEESGAFDLFQGGSRFLLAEPRHPTGEAVLKPPSPFSGTATFHRESPRAVSWRGDLRVDLPGFGRVRLAGPGTRATMCADAGC